MNAPFSTSFEPAAPPNARPEEAGFDPAGELVQALRLLECLHAGGEWWLYSRPCGRGYESDWRRAGHHKPPRASWLAHGEVFFGVHPHTGIPTTNAQGKKADRRWVRGTVYDIAAINALFAELDAKDTIRQEEWLPFYVTPDVGGLSPGQARGALQRAQTAAIDAALPQRLVEYKARARTLLEAAPLPPSALWDSGGGYQGVWLLAETVPAADDNRAELAQVQKEWVRLIGGDPSASDLNRVLRLPGSINRKPKYGPHGHGVRFLCCDRERVYAWEVLAALAAPSGSEAIGAASWKPGEQNRARRIYVPPGLPPMLGEFAPVPRLPRDPAIEAYNAATDLRGLLLGYGYTPAGARRLNRPGGATAGVQLHADNTATIYSSADPLWCGHRITPAHALCVFDYDGDVSAMLVALANGGQLPLF